MESALSTTTFTLLSLTKTLNTRRYPLLFHLHRHHSSLPRTFQLSSLQLCRILSAPSYLGVNRSCYVSPSRRLSSAGSRSFASGFRCVSSSTGDGGFGGNDGNSGGGSGGNGDNAAGDGETKPNVATDGGTDDLSALSSDVIILDVGGMSCGGCVASVKRILESQALVSAASVNLTTETAVVWPVSKAKAEPNWRKQLGDTLAMHLTNCGFESNLRDSQKENFFETFEKKMKEKHNQLKESGRRLVVSWALCAVCLVGHVSHLFGTKFAWIHAVHSTGFQMSLSLFTLLGPGRQLIVDGLKSLMRGSPNMNTLVGLGALSSFSVSSLAAFLPKLGWKTFFEEPIMLIAFVLLGRSLEQRAKLKAASDMTGLLSILPTKARLILKDDITDLSSTVEVSSNSLSIGDQILVLPGDRIPADGIVSSGRSDVDESGFTGEPLPVTKLPGAEVVAGSINLNGTLSVQVRRPGGETAMGDIVRLVEEAQAREAPVQRLADKIAGHFTYGVMALSGATFVFWSLFGVHVLPAAFHQTSPVSLALQLSCSVLVVACPCALGLATPTAVLVGTSLGARRGLLLRGGSVLEKFSMVNTVVFDKTGTLTLGRPVVTKVQAQNYAKDQSDPERTWSEADVLKLAAGVEKCTNHPIGKAIVTAAQKVNYLIAKVDEGTYIEEPGSGAVAIVEEKKVSVGTLDWIKRHGVEHFPLNEIEEFRNQSTVYVGIDGSLAGIIYVEDQIRDDAKHVIKSLSNQGITTYLLSGDKKTAAEYVASVVGIPNNHVFYEMKPDQKRMFISNLQKDENIVAMVGDGINDAAALALSHVGVAIGGGVGAASEASSVVLMQNKLSQLLDALELSRQTMKTVKQNLCWAFGYNIVGIPIAAGVLLPVNGIILTPSIAGALMGMSSVAVMANSLLLRLKFNSRKKETGGTSLGFDEEVPLDGVSVVVDQSRTNSQDKRPVTSS